jgi:hypothetical protein
MLYDKIKAKEGLETVLHLKAGVLRIEVRDKEKKVLEYQKIKPNQSIHEGAEKMMERLIKNEVIDA